MKTIGEIASELQIPVEILICIVYVLTSLGIRYYEHIYGYTPWIHESSVAALLGLVVGGLMYFASGTSIQFNNDIFFYLVLPPIIFSAGYGLKKKNFFRYINSIALFGIVGTLINFGLISAAAHYFPYIWYSPKLARRLTWKNSMLLASVLGDV